MKKISIYMAMIAIAMSSCSKEELALQDNQEQNKLQAEICQQNKSRVIIGDKNEQGKSPLLWHETDVFLGFKSASTISTNLPFYATYDTSDGDHIPYASKVDFFAKKSFKAEDIVFGLFPEKKVDKTANTENLKVQVSPEINMKDGQNAIMLGKNENGTMKFYQTMGLLEMKFSTLEGFDGLQIKANCPIASKDKSGYHATLTIPENLNEAKVILNDDDSQTVMLKKGYGDENIVYCPLPVGNDYTEITISYVFKRGWNQYVVSETPYVTIKAKETNFSIGKSIYAVDCTSSKTLYISAGLPKWTEENLTNGEAKE